MKARLITIAATAALLPLLAACNNGEAVAAAPTTVTVTSALAAPSSSAPAPAPAPAATTSAQPVAAATSDAGVNFTMPDMTGMSLQAAQDAVQQLGVLYSTSHDELGVRHQVLDRDWQVCSQNTAAGAHVTGNVEGQIDFGVVKLSERCP
jgi:hypothetical protein